jgi:hypothetical protein
MTHLQEKLAYLIGNIDRRHIQLIILIMALSMFVLGAGAPEGGTYGGGPGAG